MKQVSFDDLLSVRSICGRPPDFSIQRRKKTIPVYYRLEELQVALEESAAKLKDAVDPEKCKYLEKAAELIEDNISLSKKLRGSRENIVTRETLTTSTYYQKNKSVRATKGSPYLPRHPRSSVGLQGCMISDPFLRPNILGDHMEGWDYGFTELGNRIFYFGEISKYGVVVLGLAKLPPGVSKKRFFDIFCELLQMLRSEQTVDQDVLSFNYFCRDGRWFIEVYWKLKHYRFRCAIIDLDTTSAEHCSGRAIDMFKNLPNQLAFLKVGSNQIFKKNPGWSSQGNFRDLEILSLACALDLEARVYDGFGNQLIRHLRLWKTTLLNAVKQN